MSASLLERLLPRDHFRARRLIKRLTVKRERRIGQELADDAPRRRPIEQWSR